MATKGEKINFSAQDNHILTAIEYKHDAASCDDNREKLTPAQRLNYTHRRAALAAQWAIHKFQKIPPFSCKKPCLHREHDFACILPTLNSPPAPVCSEADNASALKAPPLKGAGVAGRVLCEF